MGPRGDGTNESVAAGEMSELENEPEVVILFCTRGLIVSRAETGKDIARTAPSVVCLRPRTDRRRMPLLNFSYEDFLDEAELMEGVVEAMEPVVNDDVVVGCLSSLELSEVRQVDSDIRDGEG